MRIITFEGPDGVGKSTQIRILKDKLEDEGYKVYVVHFPRYDTPIGKLILSILKGESEMPAFRSMQMLYVADQLDFTSQISELKKSGYDYILLDRFDLSTIVYYCSKFNDECLLDLVKGWQKGLVEPDLTIVLINNEIISEKGLNKDLDVFEKDDDFMRTIKKMYLSISKILNSRGRNITVLNTDDNKYVTAKNIEKMINERL